MMPVDKHFTYQRMRKIFIPSSILFVTLLLAVLSAAGCSTNISSANSSPPASSSEASAGITTNPDGEYSIQVFSGDSEVATLKMNDLLKLPQISVTADGKAQNGPSLLSVLESANIKDFSSVSAYGYNQGRLATAELTLNKSQIDGQVVLDISKKGTAKLAGPDIPSNSWIIDVNKLVVK